PHRAETNSGDSHTRVSPGWCTFLVPGTSSSEVALPRLMVKLENLGAHKSVVRLVTPAGYSFNLDGTSIYLTMAAIFDCASHQHPPGPEASTYPAGRSAAHFERGRRCLRLRICRAGRDPLRCGQHAGCGRGPHSRCRSLYVGSTRGDQHHRQRRSDTGCREMV